ncbi:MAG: hypothetical protein Q4P07_08600 [Ornithinimicrobium sp.]|uniref:hypothetical protein n=1 Tax=Ornithinimicrobium sp. TaxID=1977084 RepID=UPI0026E04A3B|nr:hypothetical protein [Ornithinimicrobium sp.]MDO5740193.1 hypothetical protein [Ornithinimicrobium sp.]
MSEQQKDAHETWVSGAVAMMKQNVPARHIWDRLARLLGYAEITWLDGSVRDEQGRLSGQLVVFTEQHVAVVDLREELHSHQRGFAGPREGRSDVRIMARSSLLQIESLMDEDVPRQNSRHAWDRLGPRGELQDAWPWDAPMVLVYPSMQVTVNGRVREALDVDINMTDFMLTLLGDLAA